MHLRLERRTSPLAWLLLVTDDGALRALDFSDHELRMHRLLSEHYGTYTLQEGAAPVAIARALDAYFDGDLSALADVRIATRGTTFQRDVWQMLRTIPAGTTRSYGQLATSLGRAGASRAVGAANGANPVAIVVPCHRVIGANGALTGYGGGLERKRWLLDHERRYSQIPEGVADRRREAGSQSPLTCHVQQTPPEKRLPLRRTGTLGRHVRAAF